MLSVISLMLLIPAGSSKQYSSVNFYRWVKKVKEAYIQAPDPNRVVIGGTDKEGFLLGVHAEGGDCL
jgi:hypothetical protein